MCLELPPVGVSSKHSGNSRGIEARILKIRALLNPRQVAQCVEVAGHMDRCQKAKCGQALRCFYIRVICYIFAS